MRRQAQARALIWSVAVVGFVMILLSMPQLAALWDLDAAGAGQSQGTVPPTSSPPTSSPPTSSPPTSSSPTSSPPTVPPTAPPTVGPPITIGPPITVGPPVTVRPATTRQATSSTGPAETVDDSTTTTATTTSLPELLVPAPPGLDDGPTTTIAPSSGDDGLSASTKLGLAVVGLFVAAGLIALLTTAYFFKTRPRFEDEPGLLDEAGEVGEVGAAGVAGVAAGAGGAASTDDPDATVMAGSSEPSTGDPRSPLATTRAAVGAPTPPRGTPPVDPDATGAEIVAARAAASAVLPGPASTGNPASTDDTGRTRGADTATPLPGEPIAAAGAGADNDTPGSDAAAPAKATKAPSSGAAAGKGSTTAGFDTAKDDPGSAPAPPLSPESVGDTDDLTGREVLAKLLTDADTDTDTDRLGKKTSKDD